MRVVGLILALAILLAGCEMLLEGTEGTESHISTTLPNHHGSEPVLDEHAPTVDSNEGLQAILSSMSLEQKVGQLFLVACPKNAPLKAIATYHLGGYLLFGDDFASETPDSLIKTLNGYQEASTIPMLIAVDEEGGSVCRVSSYKKFRHSRFLSPRKLLDRGGVELLLETEREKCQLLRSLGINVNMAPVCDITTDSKAFMYSRSFGRNPVETGQVVQKMLDVMAAYQVGSVLKHFPGYGNNSDTHVAMAVDNRTLGELENADLIPFASGIDADCGAIMVSHTIIAALDDKNPATLSPSVHDYLRNKMGFTGVIMTDELNMAAITNHFGTGEAAVLAVLAGNDLLCTRSYEVQYEAVLKAVRFQRISLEQIDAAVLRVLGWKQSLGLLDSLLEKQDAT